MIKMIKLYSPDVEEGVGGEEPKKKVDPPKGYKGPLPATKRKEWNDLLDYMQKEGVAGSSDLDKTDQQTGLSYLEKYRKDNPNTSLTKDDIPSIQYEQQQLRTGESFPGMSPEQTRVLRKQMNSKYLERSNSDSTSQFNSSLSRQYYPSFKSGDKDYGTDIEEYMKDFSTPKGEKERGKDKIPLPDYNDSTSRLKYAQKFKQKYGPLMEGRGDTVLKVNEVPRGASDTAKNVSINSAKQYGLDPSILYSSAMEEGMSGLFKDKSGLDTNHRKPGDYGYQDYYDDKEFPINGEQSFGLLTFVDRFPDLVKQGYLPKDFSKEFRGRESYQNSHNMMLAEYNFKNVEGAMKAKAAILKYSYDDVSKYAKEKGIGLSKKAKDFFALAEYNGGEGTFHKMLSDYHANGLIEGDSFLKKRPTSGKGLKEDSYKKIYENVIRRIQMADALKNEGHF